MTAPWRLFPAGIGGPVCRARNACPTNSVVQRQFSEASSAVSRIIYAPAPFRIFASGWPAFVVPNAFVEDRPNQTTQPVGDGADGLGVFEVRDEAVIDDCDDSAFDGAVRSDVTE